MSIRSVFMSALAAVAVSAAPVIAQTPAVSDGVVKIGVVNDQSGPLSSIGGEGSVAAARMAAEEFGGRILGVPIEIVAGDHLNKPDLGAAIVRRWFDNDHVDMVADISNSGVGFAVIALAKDRNKIVLHTSGSSDFTGKACIPTAVQWTYNSFAHGKALANALAKRDVGSWFIITIDYALGHALANDFRRAIEAQGGKVVGEVRHPLNTADFSSYLLQAQSSGAKGIALATAGTDFANIVKQAKEFNISAKQTLVATVLTLADIQAVGLPTMDGMEGASFYEWNRNDASREWAAKFRARTGKTPTGVQAAVYSQVRHYLRAVQAAGTDESGAVMAKMRELPVSDAFTDNGRVREDGQLVHDMYFIKVKKPGESSVPDDLVTVVQTIPGPEAFQTLQESACPLVRR